MYRVIGSMFFLVACTPAEQPILIDSVENQATTAVGRQSPIPAEAVLQAARREADRRFGKACRTVTIPDAAFAPVEVTGGGDPEYAVFLGGARCETVGASTYFSSTGDGPIQIWSASGDEPMLLLHHSMRGFTPTGNGLVSFQHGAFCDGGVGAQTCVVSYTWRGPEDSLEVSSRRLLGPGRPGKAPAMAYGWNYPERPEQ